MKKQRSFKLVVLGFMLTLITNTAYAASIQVSDVKITMIRTYATSAVIEFTPAYVVPQGTTFNCTGAKYRAAIEWASSADNKGLLVTALAAFSMNLDVGMGIKDSPQCNPSFGTIPIIYRMEMSQSQSQ